MKPKCILLVVSVVRFIIVVGIVVAVNNRCYLVLSFSLIVVVVVGVVGVVGIAVAVISVVGVDVFVNYC